MTAVDRDVLIADMAARRPDAVLPPDHQPPVLTSYATLLHRTAALITTEDLPPAYLSFSAESVQVTALPEDGLAQNTVRRWAAALELVVHEQPVDMDDGTAGTRWYATGFDGRGIWWSIGGRRPVPALASA